ncbi:MAG: SDR family NAD(P)-dependent oxidoreductase [Gammaproteobacteria bacterium]
MSAAAGSQQGHSMKLAGRTALVTGAARGIGRAYALRLAALGADVAILDVDLRSYAQFQAEQAQMTAESTVEEVRALGRRAIGIQADVSDENEVQAAVAGILAQWGRIDIAVCNAGGGAGTPRETRASVVPRELLETVVERNLYGTIFTCKAVAAPMRERRYGRIVTVASNAVRFPMPAGGYAHYGAAKAGIVMYTQYLAQELGPSGINVNCIIPGAVATGRMKPLFEKLGVDKVAANIALRRLCTPEDCARVVEFLVTDLSDYVTGVVIPVDGGATAV